MGFYDFTEHMTAFFQHWQREGLAFDCIYSGFLASEQQIDVVHDFIDAFSANRPLVLVDPVMGDEGKLYSTYTPQMQERMKDVGGQGRRAYAELYGSLFFYWEKAIKKN